MKTLLQFAAAFALLAFGVGAAVITWDGHCFLRSAAATVQRADGVLKLAQGEWQNEKADVHQIVARAADATSEADLFAQEQRKQLRKTSADSDHQVRALGLVTRNAETFFYNLDQQVNGKVLPAFTDELTSTATVARTSLTAFGDSAGSITAAGDALTAQFNNPEWGQTLHGLNITTQSLSLASANGASILGHGDHVAAYYDKKLTTPIGFWKTLLYGTLDIGSKVGNISAGFVK